MWGWRTLVVNSDSKLRLLNGNLYLERENEALSLPIDDIDIVIVESISGTLSVPLIRECVERGIGIVITDSSLMPGGIFLPFNSSRNFSGSLFNQLELKLPFKKQIWKKIVTQKITNQAIVLKILGKKESDILFEIAKNVKSGDPDNREAYAAKIYFNSVLPNFTRGEENPINAALNYGYAIIRSALARAFSATGLICALGIKHTSKTNPFNLVDDFIEAFRPFVDLIVFTKPPEKELTPEYKKYLISVLRLECLILSKTFSISTASWRVAQSYAQAVRKKTSSCIELPQVDELAFREYE